MDIDYSEENFLKDFTSEDLRILIKYHLKRKEATWLEFKRVPKYSSKEKNRLMHKWPKVIQAIANAGGGTLILGVDQKNPTDPIEGVDCVDNWCNTLSQISNNLHLPILFPVRSLKSKKLIFILIPQPRKPVSYKFVVRIRKGTSMFEINPGEEYKKLEKKLLQQPSGFNFIGRMKAAIRIYRWHAYKEKDLDKGLLFSILAEKYENDSIIVTLILFLYAKLEALNIKTESKEFTERKRHSERQYKTIIAVLIWVAGVTFLLSISQLIFLTEMFPSGFYQTAWLIYFILAIGGPIVIIHYLLPQNDHTKIPMTEDEWKEFFKPHVPLSIPIGDIRDEILKKKDIYRVMSVILQHLFYFYLLQSFNIERVEIRPGGATPHGRLNQERNPFIHNTEFSIWLKNQLYVPKIRNPPPNYVIKMVRSLASNAFTTSSRRKEDNINQEFLFESIQYMLLHFLFLLDYRNKPST